MMRWGLALILCLWAGLALALDPEEMLPDPAQEARARALDGALRCVKCQSESLASSNAIWARDARRTVREQVAAGRTDAEILDWFVARYGEFVLMDPPKRGLNWVLWLAGPALLLGGCAIALGLYRRKDDAVAEADDLTADEEARLEDLLKDRV